MSNNEEVIAAAKRLKQYHNDGFIRSEFRGDMDTVLDSILPTPTFVLPTKRWAQVLDGEGFLWTRHTNGDWWTSTGHWNLGERLITQCRPLHVISEGIDDE
jgi:hypothetical protein